MTKKSTSTPRIQGLIQPCPFCVVSDPEIEIDRSMGKTSAVRCRECGASGPVFRVDPDFDRGSWDGAGTIELFNGAIAKWNSWMPSTKPVLESIQRGEGVTLGPLQGQSGSDGADLFYTLSPEHRKSVIKSLGLTDYFPMGDAIKRGLLDRVIDEIIKLDRP